MSRHTSVSFELEFIIELWVRVLLSVNVRILDLIAV